jgi:hypothetical protein
VPKRERNVEVALLGVSLRHLLRSRPTKLSMKAFRRGLPGMTMLVSSVPLSDTELFG